jgi:para-nitrobenzyl esterase
LDDTIVEIESGRIAGRLSDKVLSFKGIPYAAPPVGDLRWRAPQPVTPWHGVRPAARYGLDCMQKPIPGDAAASGSAFGEDCLFVNVWRPAVREAGARLPVLVWIHGGGFLNGSSDAPIFDGSALAREGLVVVSLNYCLGRLGFFMHPTLTAGGRTYGIGPASVAQAEQAGLAFARSMGITGSGPDALAALRALPVEKVNGDLSMEALLTKPDTYAGGPIPDGRIVTGMGMPSEALRKRTAAYEW